MARRGEKEALPGSAQGQRGAPVRMSLRVDGEDDGDDDDDDDGAED